MYPVKTHVFLDVNSELLISEKKQGLEELCKSDNIVFLRQANLATKLIIVLARYILVGIAIKAPGTTPYTSLSFPYTTKIEKQCYLVQWGYVETNAPTSP